MAEWRVAGSGRARSVGRDSDSRNVWSTQASILESLFEQLVQHRFERCRRVRK